eukprot:SAG11_NODE_840_length_6909_cov_27.081057_10_plen_162_part_00
MHCYLEATGAARTARPPPKLRQTANAQLSMPVRAAGLLAVLVGSGAGITCIVVVTKVKKSVLSSETSRKRLSCVVRLQQEKPRPTRVKLHLRACMPGRIIQKRLKSPLHWVELQHNAPIYDQRAPLHSAPAWRHTFVRTANVREVCTMPRSRVRVDKTVGN